ncbi:PTS sugar transporter subunit IIA [Hyphobacterium sp.]|jgi:PTS system mannose-specific IIA component|uniref:PTS sugar transporter subunit IIA n=1 Tax=Hyphobacterium sp. TaxID=2004662 RepID=UPI003BAA64C5
MIGFLIVTHGELAREFLAATEHVVGALEQCEAVCIGADDDLAERRDDLSERIRRLDTGSGVLILTDMFGGTPSNLAISQLSPGKVDVLAGINLPMMIKLVESRETLGLEALAEAGEQAGQRYIARAARVLESANK